MNQCFHCYQVCCKIWRKKKLTFSDYGYVTHVHVYIYYLIHKRFAANICKRWAYLLFYRSRCDDYSSLDFRTRISNHHLVQSRILFLGHICRGVVRTCYYKWVKRNVQLEKSELWLCFLCPNFHWSFEVCCNWSSLKAFLLRLIAWTCATCLILVSGIILRNRILGCQSKPMVSGLPPARRPFTAVCWAGKLQAGSCVWVMPYCLGT